PARVTPGGDPDELASLRKRLKAGDRVATHTRGQYITLPDGHRQRQSVQLKQHAARGLSAMQARAWLCVLPAREESGVGENRDWLYFLAQQRQSALVNLLEVVAITILAGGTAGAEVPADDLALLHPLAERRVEPGIVEGVARQNRPAGQWAGVAQQAPQDACRRARLKRLCKGIAIFVA